MRAMVVTTGTDALVAPARPRCGTLSLIDAGRGAGGGDQVMDAQSIVAAEAGLARGVYYGVLFAVPLWIAIATSIALMLSA